MTEFKKNYKELKTNINSENTKLISFLIYGIILGRLLEKIKKAPQISLRGFLEFVNVPTYLFALGKFKSNRYVLF